MALTRFMTIRPLIARSTHVRSADTQRKPQPRRGLGVPEIFADISETNSGQFVFVMPPDEVLSYPVPGATYRMPAEFGVRIWQGSMNYSPFVSRLLSCCAVVSLLWAGFAWADLPRLMPPKQEGLQAVLERIRMHAGNDAWKQGGFSDEVIEKWLEKLVGEIAKEAKLPELKVPVKQAELAPVDLNQRNAAPRGLIICKDLKPGMLLLRNSIVLADGKVSVESAHDCVIIARGAVTVKHSQGSVIVSGVHVSIPMLDGVPNDAKRGSLLVSRGRVDVRSTYGSRIVSPAGFDADRSPLNRDLVLINTPAKPVNPAMAALFAGRGAPPVMVQIPGLPLDLLPEHGMSNKISLLGAVHAERQVQIGFGAPVIRSRADVVPVGAVIRYQGKRYVADLDQPIVDEAEEVVAGLRGWTLTFVDEKTAIFSSGEADAVVRAAE